MKKFKILLLVLGYIGVAACTAYNDEKTRPADGAKKVEAPKVEPPKLVTGNGTANYILIEDVRRTRSTFVFSKVAIDQPGWLVLHPFRDGAPVPTEYVGATLLSKGVSTDVEITASGTVQADQMFVVMLHYDVNQDGVFDFNDGITVPDVPVFESGTLIALRFAAPEED